MFQSLPLELKYKICYYLEVKDILNLASTSKALIFLLSDNYFWKCRTMNLNIKAELFDQLNSNPIRRHVLLMGKEKNIYIPGSEHCLPLNACIYGCLITANLEMTDYFIKKADKTAIISVLLAALDLLINRKYRALFADSLYLLYHLKRDSFSQRFRVDDSRVINYLNRLLLPSLSS